MYTHIPLLFRSTLAVALGVATPSLLLAGEPSPHVILVRTAPKIAPIPTAVQDDKPAPKSEEKKSDEQTPDGPNPDNTKSDEKKPAPRKQEAKESETQVEAQVLLGDADDQIQVMPAYWLGIHLEPLPELAKSQLTLEHGIVVHATLPDSPAAKVGLKQYDILLDADGTALKEPVDLINVLEKSQEKPIKLTYLRAGKKASLEVTPSKRPENLPELAAQVEQAVGEGVGDLDAPIRKLEEAIRGLHARHGGVPGLWVVRPPVAAPPGAPIPPAAPPMPADLSININKSGNAPAKIVVKQGDKKWEVTEDKLGELPESIRGHVERMLGSAQVEVVANPLADGQLRLQVRRIERPDMLPPGAVPHVQRLLVVPPGVPGAPAFPGAPAVPAPPAPPGARVIQVVPAPIAPQPGAPVPGDHGLDTTHKDVRVHVIQKKDNAGEELIVKKLDEVLKRLESLEKKLK